MSNEAEKKNNSLDLPSFKRKYDFYEYEDSLNNKKVKTDSHSQDSNANNDFIQTYYKAEKRIAL